MRGVDLLLKYTVNYSNFQSWDKWNRCISNKFHFGLRKECELDLVHRPKILSNTAEIALVLHQTHSATVKYLFSHTQ